MTSPRINLAELRMNAQAAASGPTDWRHFKPSSRAPSGGFWQDIDPATVLALVEAVEAAQAVTTNQLNPDAHRRLRAALAPFVEET